MSERSDRRRSRVPKHASEAEFRRQLAELDQIYHNSPVGLVVVDRDLRFVRINERMAEIDGTSADEHLGRTLDEVLPELAGELKPLYQRVLDQGDPIRDVEFGGTPPKASGRTRYWLASYYPMRSGTGEIVGVLGAVTEITERKQTEQALLLTQFAVDNGPDAVFWIDRNARFAYVNDTACRSLGYTREELLRLSVPDIDPTWPMDTWDTKWDENRSRGSVTFETVHQRKDGVIFPVEITASFIDYGGQALDCAYARDISERKRSEEALRSANRVLAALSRVNEILVRAADEPELLRDVCQAIVDIGGYRMVWVGFAADDETKTVRPAAHAGHENGYLDRVSMSWGDGELGACTAGTAIRTGELCVVRDVQAAPSYGPWRQEAMKRGYGCSVALPLTVSGRVAGAICLYRSEPGCLESAEEKLLSQLASDLSYGITSLRVLAERSAAEAERRALEQQLEEHKRKFYRETILSVTNGKLSICDAADVNAYITRASLTVDVRRMSRIGDARKEVEAFCESSGLIGEELSVFALGVGEAITNALKHGVRGRVYAGASDGEVWAGVKDVGAGIESLILPRAVLRRGFSTKPSLGLGYSIMLDAVDAMLLRTGARGTTVVLIKSLRPDDRVFLDTIPDTW